MIFGKSAALAVLILAVIALLILLWMRRKRRQGTYQLQRDHTGLWRYHPETQFDRRVAYEKKLLKAKKKKKSKSADGSEKQSVAVLTFDGDVRAKQHKNFAKLVDEVLVNREDLAEVVVVLTSPGGAVPHYGHVFAEMERVRTNGIPLTVCIDVVAASGGYLMSLPANKIIAAPFSIVGSVGVVAFVPNVRNFLQNNDITPRTFTAGKYKRTVTMTDDATPEEIERFQGQLEAIHKLFLDAVRKYRPAVNFAEVETGQHWTARESVELSLGLVDEISTSHDYLLERNKTHDLVLINQRRNLWEDGLGRFGMTIVDGVVERMNSMLR